MSDQPTQPAEPPEQPPTPPAPAEPAEDAPTPEERVAETEPTDPDVGSDGTGIGELP